MNCPYCENEMIWQADADYRDAYGDYDGVVRYFTCSNKECGTDIEISRKDNKGDE